APSRGRGQPSYSKPILSSTRYSTISLSSTIALDFTTSTVRMLRTVFEAVATATRAASDHERGLVPTISRMMITPLRPSRMPRSMAPGGTRRAAPSSPLEGEPGLRPAGSSDESVPRDDQAGAAPAVAARTLSKHELQ